ncbi:2-oxoacid:acceptor oxidoreductase subunit alpha [Desulfobacter hydrogenophilus]|uniref:2-oxoacid:acceptor oxidoreductase subunit alpha n=1 Tax=Desulfobacter hydrogenophilus TaxID=2291 RepID=A0A328FG25_9BACT|nr:2-oxoacid:acceptor oxidoreductase subunit alpha [Desulfobacter hydrogenophilus]NDY70645.1 2-oxoacid:acceptor oxidoreductase subunit alpha [Desulfobacter hydrogenophilus]QBH14009.1 2-oxoacid:acceptor oxidoreductase subunit alpha [Desulfobacter hydrogenophilus]RAM03574.1 2-oxoacid:acceptor oxidoreductase subunit alpha [Desulfobacter hydrogenophilus]
MDITILIGGAAGQGIQTIGTLLSAACCKAGYFAMAVNDFESRVRGGHSFFKIRISNAPVYASRESVDLLIALDKNTWEIHSPSLRDNSVVLADEDFSSSGRIVPLAFEQLAKETGSNLFINTVAAAAGLRVLGAGPATVQSTIKDHFSGLKEDLLEKNLDAAQKGFEKVADVLFEEQPLAHPSVPKGNLISGAKAIALGAAAADCRIGAFYPMSPATSIMQHLTDLSKRLDIVVEQAEDEIAAANIVIGASFAGARAMTATSGGGFCLMTEALGLAGMTETPMVIVNAMRPGPSTGLPTRTAQGDLRFAIHASHDDFPRFVFAPGTPTQAFEQTRKAFYLSEKYQVPAIILADQYLLDSLFLLEKPFFIDKHVERFIVTDDDMPDPGGYERFAVTDSGISPRALPCKGKALVKVSSDEHRPDGHITEDIAIRNTMMEKRRAKLPAMIEELDGPETVSPDAHTLLIGWGSSAGAIKEATDLLRDQGADIGCLLFSQIWPFPATAAEKMLKNNPDTQFIAVEMNAEAQFAGILKENTNINFSGYVLKYDGRPFTAQFIVDALKEKELA